MPHIAAVRGLSGRLLVRLHRPVNRTPTPASYGGSALALDVGLYDGRRWRDDQWIAEIFHPPAVFTRTINSAPLELIALPLDSPCAVLVDQAHAASPRTVIRMALRSIFTLLMNAISAATW